MRRIYRTKQFEKDFRREVKGTHRDALATDFPAIIANLADDRPLAAQHRDHQLTGNWRGHRDCHGRPDLILIYWTPDRVSLQLRLDSHSELRR